MQPAPTSVQVASNTGAACDRAYLLIVTHRGPGPIVFVLAGIVLLVLGGLVATIVISVRHDVASGYVEDP